jgi:hypothetical protein
MPSNPNKPFADALDWFRTHLSNSVGQSLERLNIYYDLRLRLVSDKEANQLIDDHIKLGYFKPDGSFLEVTNPHE